MASPSRTPEVLLVDDEPVVREFFRDTLAAAALNVTAVPHMEAALAYLDTHVPDVVVLDLGMPPGRMQGIEMLVQMRAVDRWRAIPVIVLSAYGEIVNRDVTGRLGVVEIFTKPLLEVEGLVDSIRRVSAAA